MIRRIRAFLAYVLAYQEYKAGLYTYSITDADECVIGEALIRIGLEDSRSGTWYHSYQIDGVDKTPITGGNYTSAAQAFERAVGAVRYRYEYTDLTDGEL